MAEASLAFLIISRVCFGEISPTGECIFIESRMRAASVPTISSLSFCSPSREESRGYSRISNRFAQRHVEILCELHRYPRKVRIY